MMCAFPPVFGCSLNVDLESDDTEEIHLSISVLKNGSTLLLQIMW